MNTYRLGHGTPMLGVPSISPIFDNNPAFLVATVGPRGGIRDYTAYALNLAQPAARYTREYGFGDTYGLPAFNPASLNRLGPLLGLRRRAAQRLRALLRLRRPGRRSPTQQYPAYACATTALDVPAFTACLGRR